MSAELWGRVDDYIVDKLVDEDAVLAETLRTNAASGLRPIDVSAAQGKFLNLLVRVTGARRILEIGTSVPTRPSGWPAPCRPAASW